MDKPRHYLVYGAKVARDYLAIVIMTLLTTSCISLDSGMDGDGAKIDLESHRVRSEVYWGDWRQKPLSLRISLAPTEMIEFMRLDNEKSKISFRPRKAALNVSLLKDVRKALNDLPEIVKRKLADKLAAIVLMENIGGTGYTNSIFDKNRKPYAGFIILDAIEIDRKANEWATKKEASPFIASVKFNLRATIEPEETNNRVQTIQYMLLHEGAHVLAIGESFHPSWDSVPVDLSDSAGFPFFNLSWEINKNKDGYIPHGDCDFAGRSSVIYYFGAKLEATQSVDIYRRLQKQSFVSLYASTNPYDDFAESFAIYVHKTLQNKPWKVEIDNAGTSFSYDPLWSGPRLSAKKALIAAFLKE